MTIGAIVPLPSGVEPAAVFTPVGGEAVLARLVRAVFAPDRPLVVVAAGSLADGARECLDAHGLSAAAVAAAPSRGGRRDCVTRGLEYLVRERVSTSQVLLHDHRHPLADESMTDRVVEGLRTGHSVVVPAVVMTDSVKAVDDRGSVGGTVDRGGLRIVQFPRGLALRALAELLDEDDIGGFDELSAAMRAGLPIAVVEGDAEAVRIELPADADLLAATTVVGRSG
jgi:2-C-methyl-D-erythritol 4-phosphate cytidylyltransferase